MARRSFLLTAILLGITTPAFADDPDPSKQAPPPSSPPPSAAPEKKPARTDTVRLRNGGLSRGRVIEIVPEDHVTIVELDGQKKQIAWSEIDRVIIGGPAPTRSTLGTTNTPMPPASKPTPKAPMDGPVAKVHLAASKRVVLYRRPAGTGTWEIACESPCDERLPIGDEYRVTGNGIAQSDEFKLTAPADGGVYIHVHASNTGRVLGGILASTGALVGYIGLLVVASNSSSFEKDERATGLVALGVGTAMATVGIILFLVTGGTDVTQSPDSKTAKSEKPSSPATWSPTWSPVVASPSKPVLDAFLRKPLEKSSSVASDPAVLAPPATFPILFQKQF